MRRKGMNEMDISNIISLLSGTALFLFGMSLMGDGLKKVAGNRLEILLYKLTNTPWKGILLGTGVTAVIQSSSATSAMVVGFVNSGMMKFSQSIGIILGSIIGTSITGWVICLSSIGGGSGWVQLLSTATITGVISIAGTLLRMFGKKQSHIHTGDIMLGFAVLMFGMSAMSGSVAPLTESEAFIHVLTVFSNPLLGILAGLLFTAILQSASATVGILQALAITGAIDFATAFPLIMGISVGSAVPVLLSALGANTDGKRTSVVYLLTNVFGTVLCGSVFYAVNFAHPLPFLGMTMSAVTIALLNTTFRLVTVLALWPLVGALEKLTCRLVKDGPAAVEKKPNLIRPEDRFLPYPPLAISQCREFMIAMAAGARNSLIAALSLTTEYSEDGFQRVAQLEEESDRYEDGIGTYLMKITRRELSKGQNAEVSEFFHTLPDLERISDHALNIAETAQEIHQKGITYSDDAMHELAVIHGALAEIASLTVDAFSRSDLRLAARVEPLEEVIDDLVAQLKQNHVTRLRQGSCSLEQGFTFNNLLVDCERISDHCSNIALALLERDTGVVGSHEYLKNLEDAKQVSFTHHFEEYQQKYAL